MATVKLGKGKNVMSPSSVDISSVLTNDSAAFLDQPFHNLFHNMILCKQLRKKNENYYKKFIAVGWGLSAVSLNWFIISLPFLSHLALQQLLVLLLWRGNFVFISSALLLVREWTVFHPKRDRMRGEWREWGHWHLRIKSERIIFDRLFQWTIIKL